MEDELKKVLKELNPMNRFLCASSLSNASQKRSLESSYAKPFLTQRCLMGLHNFYEK